MPADGRKSGQGQKIRQADWVGAREPESVQEKRMATGVQDSTQIKTTGWAWVALATMMGLQE